MLNTVYPHIRVNFIYAFFSCIVSAAGLGLNAQTPDSTLFRDDFNRTTFGSFWQAAPSWSIVDGAAFNFIDGTGGALKTTTSYAPTSYIIETSARGFTNAYKREFKITFGQADLSVEKLYQLRYTAYLGGRLTLSRLTGDINSSQVLDEVAVFPELNSIDFYKFKIAKYKSGLIQVYVDKGSGYTAVPILEAIDITYAKLDHTGWQVDTETSPESFYVDWISARKPGIEKPAIKEKPIEDDLISQVSAKSGKSYIVAKLNPGVKQLIDRNYTITTVPDYLKGTSFIQTANEDKLNATDSFLNFFIKTDAIVYVGYDSRSTELPAWLREYSRTADRIGISDTKAGYLNVYSKLVGQDETFPNPVILGGNLAKPAAGAQTNYLVAVIKRPVAQNLQAEDALVSGGVVANNHTGYKGNGFVDFKNLSDDFIEWTVKIDVPGTYNLGFTFANAGLKERSLQITDNGTESGTAIFSAVSSSWSTWAFLSGPNIFLSSGIHKIRITANGTSGPNIDELSVSFVSPSAPVSLFRPYLPYDKASNKLADQTLKAYPNPFLQSTKIYYSLKEKTNVLISVYSLQGQLLQVLQNGILEPGSYEATFNAGKFAKGIYFYRLQIGKDVKEGKLIKQ